MKIIKFKSPTCEPCKIMAPYIERAKIAYPQVAFQVVDVSNDPEGIASNYLVRTVPTIIAIDDSGVLDVKRDAMTEPQLKQWIEGLL